MCLGSDFIYTLYIDTHSNNLIIALLKDGVLLSLKELESLQSHSIHTMPMIDGILKDNNLKINDIKEIIVVNGPGSFTGVRIGVTIAKTLAFTLNIPIKTISSLLIKVISSEKPEKITLVTDRNGKFVGEFNGNEQISEYRYLKNDEYEEYIKDKNMDIIDNIDIDYKKVYEYLREQEGINPHIVNPIYVKNIEV